MANPSPKKPGLAKVLGFWSLVIYGVGDILGAGIYALVGKVVGISGEHSWLAFLTAFIVSGFTALSYAELSGRIPRSGGGAAFLLEGFRSPFLSTLIGWMVLCSGMVSMATTALAFAGYAHVFLPFFPSAFWIVLFLSILVYLNIKGMRESAFVNVICTAIEVTGLLIVIITALHYLAQHDSIPISASPATGDFFTILQGGALVFFAFIGFEDLVNVAEDAKNPEKDMPKAILMSLTLVGIIYMLILVLVVRVLPQEQLAQSAAPLVDVVAQTAPYIPRTLFSFIAVVAITNTALLNLIMGSRLIYGMAEDRLLPRWFGHLHLANQTPVNATLFIFFAVLLMTFTGSIVYLAGTTSALLLIIFCLVHLALFTIKRRNPGYTGFQIPLFFPVIGCCLCLMIFFFVPLASFLTTFFLIITGMALILLKPKIAS